MFLTIIYYSQGFMVSKSIKYLWIQKVQMSNAFTSRVFSNSQSMAYFLYMTSSNNLNHWILPIWHSSDESWITSVLCRLVASDLNAKLRLAQFYVWKYAEQASLCCLDANQIICFFQWKIKKKQIEKLRRKKHKYYVWNYAE